jgi:beta-lactamase superfamily II metal-dependent hydrolase
MTKLRLTIAAALALACVALLGAADTLDIYFIDVEGGQATLIVTPARESLLVDTGYAGNNGRDPARIMAAVRDAGLDDIDYLLITHFHPDHDGGVVELAERVPIRAFIDHGGFGPEGQKVARPEAIAAYQAYLPVRARGKHLEPKPGERLPLTGVEVVFVSSAGETIGRPVHGSGASTSTCPSSAPAAGNLENTRSTGFHLRFGEFRFIDLGDLSGEPLYSLVCPTNKLGRVDAYLVPHHGGNDVSHPVFVSALGPRVAIVNNGATKGGDAKTLEMLRASGLEDVWQLHRSRNTGVVNFADERIANLDETTGHWLKLSANADGSFRVTNQRTGATRDYPKARRH